MNYRIMLDLYMDDDILTENEISDTLKELINEGAVGCSNVKLIKVLEVDEDGEIIDYR